MRFPFPAVLVSSDFVGISVNQIIVTSDIIASSIHFVVLTVFELVVRPIEDVGLDLLAVG
jgi:hypothetical protein